MTIDINKLKKSKNLGILIIISSWKKLIITFFSIYISLVLSSFIIGDKTKYKKTNNKTKPIEKKVR